ncbi:unnamed protein product [Periconia digitata]|uniref:Uncharacterized protein n=1 Tax=Periconia digitata TaxID=1303443 RepID=A0A9W4UFM0_9PLEO|nr:unnamed protein product [Periconia digitata]
MLTIITKIPHTNHAHAPSHMASPRIGFFKILILCPEVSYLCHQFSQRLQT